MRIYSALQKIFCFFMLAAIVLILSMDGYAVAVLVAASVIFALRSKKIPHFTSLLLLAGIVLRIMAIFFIHPPVESDFAVMFDSARAVKAGDYSFQYTPYFTLWAYQTAFVAWEAIWLSLWDSVVCLRLVNAVMGAATVVLIYRIARNFVSENAAQAAAILLTLQPFELTYHLVLSNQIPSAFFLISGVWILVSNDCRKLGAWRFPLAGLALQLGNILRSEGIIILCALFAWAVFELVRHPQFGKRVILCALSLFAVYITAGEAADFAVKASGLNRNGLRNGNPGWKIVSGMNYETIGAYSQDDWIKITYTLDENYDTTEATAILQKGMIRDRFLAPPKQLAGLMLNKMRILWFTDNLDNLSFGHIIEKYPHRLVGLLTFQYLFPILQQYNLGMMLAAVCLATIGLRHRKEWAPAAYMPYFVFFAAFCAFLIVEVQPRYVYLPQQFVFCGAAFGIDCLSRNLKQAGTKRDKEESRRLTG